MAVDLPYDEKKLLERIAEHDQSAFDDVYNSYYERLLFFARKFVSLESAEDILSEAFVKLWTSAGAGQFKSLPEVEQWLRVTTRNACIDELRKEGRTQRKEEAYLYLMDDRQAHELYFKSALEAELFSKIAREINKLPPLTSRIIKLSFLQGLSVDEIALRLNLSKQVVYNKKSLGIKALRLSISDKDLAMLLLLVLGNIGSLHTA
ncbi:MAG TPA: sigma-70 family RNA polymerase sigma factor [Flavitalea sp.]|nr:sigma-70 family RNA polymerase sigma factor [Flavitalea sp.]